MYLSMDLSSTPEKPIRSINMRPIDFSHADAARVDTEDVNRQTDSYLGKRKCDDVVDAESSRAFLKRNNIKITDLCAMQESRSKGKHQKESKKHFRVYPLPITSFKQLESRFGLHHSLAANIAEQGYIEPTEVQMATLPLLFDTESCSDILIVAPTGSGKTLAFLVPLVQRIIQSQQTASQQDAEKPSMAAIVLAPTKELVHQIINEGRKLTANTGVKISTIRKGMRIAGLDQDKSRAAKVNDLDSDDGQRRDKSSNDFKSNILVATPLSLLNAMSMDGDVDAGPLSQLQHLVFDEADFMFDTKFRDQTVATWKACHNPNLQVSLWSATMTSNIEEFATDTMKKLRGKSSQPAHRVLRCVVGLKDSVLSSISHQIVYTKFEHGKLDGLRNIRNPLPSQTDKKQPRLRFPFLVFTQTIERAIILHSELKYEIPAEAGGATRVAVLHSELSDTERADVMARFRNAKIWMLITTDLLSRGIDFRGVNGIVNWDIPTTVASYVHRTGRTNRAGRRGGIAVTMWTDDDKQPLKLILTAVVASQRASGIEPNQIHLNLLEGLPNVGKKVRKELKRKGIPERQRIRQQDDEETVRAKRKARIGTQRGYLLQKENNKKGATEASKRRKNEAQDQNQNQGEDSEWNGF